MQLRCVPVVACSDAPPPAPVVAPYLKGATSVPVHTGLNLSDFDIERLSCSELSSAGLCSMPGMAEGGYCLRSCQHCVAHAV